MNTRVVAAAAGLVVTGLCAGQSCLPNWSAVGDNITGGAVYALATHDGGKGAALYAGGDLTLDGSTLCSVARWDGQLWAAVGARFQSPGGLSSVPPSVRTLASFDDGTGPALYAAGSFRANGVDCAARWDGTQWNPIGQGLASTINVLAPAGISLVVYDGTLYMGGHFALQGQGSFYNKGLVRWTGNGWDLVAGGLRGIGQFDEANVTSMVTFQGSLWVSGFFWGGASPLVAAPSMARFDGAAWHPTGTGGGGILTIHDDGSGPTVWMSGARKYVPPSTWVGFTCWSSPTTSESGTNAFESFNDGTGPALYHGGEFSWLYSGTYAPARNLARWTGACVPSPQGPNAAVYAMLRVHEGGQDSLLVGGAFTEVGGTPVARVARLGQCTTCYPDCNGDGALNLADFGCFMTKFAQGNLYADCNGDGLLQLSDFGCFQTKFLFGCP